MRDVVTLSAPNTDYEVSTPVLDFTADTVAMNFVRRFTGGTDNLVQLVHRSAGAYGSPGETSEGSAATRIEGDRNDTSRPRSGAVWLY